MLYITLSVNPWVAPTWDGFAFYSSTHKGSDNVRNYIRRLASRCQRAVFLPPFSFSYDINARERFLYMLYAARPKGYRYFQLFWLGSREGADRQERAGLIIEFTAVKRKIVDGA